MGRRFAIVSDVHGNWRALDAVVLDLERHDITDVVNLGDCLYGPFDPRPASETLMNRNWPTVSGNEDQALADAVSGLKVSRVAHFTARQLGSEQIAWIKRLPQRLDVLGSTAFHARPDGKVAYLLTSIRDDGLVRQATASEIVLGLGPAQVSHPIVLCGHDHLPRIVTLPDGRVLVNPGSVGCPAYTHDDPVDHVIENRTPHARYAIIEAGAGGASIQLVAVPYDWDGAADEAAQNGFADWAHWIGTGWAR